MGFDMVLFIVVIAFFCEYVDSTLGMGYGTILTPVLLLMGFQPLEIVPCVLFSELCTGLTSGIFHHKQGNISLEDTDSHFLHILPKIKKRGLIRGLREGTTFHLKIVLSLVSASIIGASIAVHISNIIPKQWIQLYIGFIVVSMGAVILLSLKRTFKFSWIKIAVLGLLASFNKGLTGGGYGPLIASGQVLSGVETKSIAGTTGFAEGITCAIGIVLYLFTSRTPVDWKLAPFITGGALLAIPFAVKSVKRMPEKKLKFFIGLLSLALGIFALYKTLSG
jgi:uncharacterized protein